MAGEAWAAGHTGKSTIVVGDIDTGVDYTHRDLYLNVWLNQSELPKTMGLVDYDKDGLITFRDLNHWVNIAFVKDVNANGYVDAGDLLRDTRWADGVDQNGNGYKDDLIGWDFVNNDNDPYDDNGHGTHTAGTIGATGGNGPGVAGVNWNVGIIALKFLDKSGSGSLDNAIKAHDYYTATSASDQSHNRTSEFIGTNNSWGGGGYSDSLLAAIVRGAKQDALFIAAAGNGGSDKKGDNNDSIGNYPSNYSTLNGAGYETVIAVSALTSAGALASYSNYGIQSVDLGAPGSAIWSTVPGGYASYSGTSMATPHVTGALALYASLHPDYTAGQLRAALLSSSDATASLAGKTVTGGRLNIGNVAPAANEVVSVTIDGVNDTDVLVGTSADDTINGLGGDDVITGGSGNDMIDGGTGVNTAVYTGAFKNYAVTFSKGSSTIGVHAKVGTDDIDTLNNIQKLQATDGTLDATWFSATAGLSSTQLTELTQLYIASFNRAPDAIGLAYWGAQLSGGMALSSVAASFFVQPEAAVAYPSNQPTQTFVNASYGNVLGRQADAAGLNYWVSQLDGGVVGKNTFVLALLNGAVGADVGYLANKVAVGQHFALAQGLSNAAAARSVMAIVSSQPSSVETANALTDLYAASASTSPDTELVVKILGIVD